MLREAGRRRMLLVMNTENYHVHNPFPSAWC